MGTPTEVNNPNAEAVSLEETTTNANAIILANAGELAAGIISEISGNDIATSINGSKATVEIIQNLLYQRVMKRVKARLNIR